MKIRIYYHKSGCVEIDAATEEEALDKFSEIDNEELENNCFSDGYHADDWERVKE